MPVPDGSRLSLRHCNSDGAWSDAGKFFVGHILEVGAILVWRCFASDIFTTSLGWVDFAWKPPRSEIKMSAATVQCHESELIQCGSSRRFPRELFTCRQAATQISAFHRVRGKRQGALVSFSRLSRTTETAKNVSTRCVVKVVGIQAC